MNAREIAVSPEIGAQPCIEFGGNLVRIALELLRAIFRQLRHRRLGPVPGARTILVEIGGGSGEPPQRVAEHLRRFARHDAAELHPSVLDPAMRRRSGRS